MTFRLFTLAYLTDYFLVFIIFTVINKQYSASSLIRFLTYPAGFSQEVDLFNSAKINAFL